MLPKKDPARRAFIGGKEGETPVKKIVTALVCLALISLVAFILLPFLMAFMIK
jgi:hypothetical protein